MKKEFADFFEGAIGIVEATNCEQLNIWMRNSEKETPLAWKENLFGHGKCVGNVKIVKGDGSIEDMPVCISLTTAVIDSHKIIIWDATSQVVDFRMIDQWFKDNLPETAFRSDGYPNKTDAMNFYNVFPR